MKKIALLLSFAATAFAAHAQLHLSGASPYTQDFNTLTTSMGLPTGWGGYSGATASSIGTIWTWSNSTKFGVWADSITGGIATPYYGADIYGKGFKNSASADVSHPTDTGGVQRTQANRAFAVKQTSFAGFDPSAGSGGPAFVLHLANTAGITGLGVQFQLQSLDYTNPSVTAWTVDAGVGASPTVYTPASSILGTSGLTTGGYTFKNDTVTASFGTALDNKSQEVWIRIVDLAATTGGGTRTCTGIDDFKLTWTGTAGTKDGVSTVSAQPSLSLVTLGESTSDKVDFVYSAETDATYSFVIYDLTGRIHHTENINAQTGIEKITVNGLHLTAGMYFAKMSNGNSSTVAKFVVR